MQEATHMPDAATARPRNRLRDIEAMHEAAGPRSAAYRHFLLGSAQILQLAPVSAWRSSRKTAQHGRTTLEAMALSGPRFLPALQRLLAAETWASTLLAAVGALGKSGWAHVLDPKDAALRGPLLLADPALLRRATTARCSRCAGCRASRRLSPLAARC